MQMLRMQVQNSPQTQQVQVVQAQPQIIQVRYFKQFLFFNHLLIFIILRWPLMLMGLHQFTYPNHQSIRPQAKNNKTKTMYIKLKLYYS